MAKQLHLTAIHRMANKALASGGIRTNMSRIKWDVAGSCQHPHITEFYGRPSGDEDLRQVNNRKRHIVVGTWTRIPMTVELHTPCRKCDVCKRKRQRLWAARAFDEARMATRTWFGTLTLRPEAWYQAQSQCRAKEDLQGVDFDTLPKQEQLALLHARVGADVTKMVKRIRGLVPAEQLRFLVVLEITKNGVIHYHVLIHERSDAFPVRHSQLKNQWPLGFSQWKLLTAPKQAGYVAKYLSKSLLARVRASSGYGTGTRVVQTHENA